MKIGRPRKLNAELREKAEGYIDNYIDEQDSVIPSVAGLAIYLKVSRGIIYKWAEEDDTFLDILEGILAVQEQKCLSNGLTGEFNATIAKLVLGKHGYKDQQESDSNINLKSSVPVSFTDPE